MRRTLPTLLLSLLLLLSPLRTHAGDGIVDPGSPPTVTAAWDGPRSAVVAWEGSGAVWRIPAAGGAHWLISGAAGAVRLGPGGDQAYAPQPGDRFELRSLETGAVLAVAELGRQYQVILPIVVK